MKSYYNSKKLIDRVRTKGSIPVSDQLFKDTDILEFANEEIDLGIVPTVLQLHEDYFLHSQAVPLESNKQKYSIPYRAIGNKLRDVQFRDTNGQHYEMKRIPVDYLPDYRGIYTTSRPEFFYVENNHINIVKGSSELVGDLVFSYYMRPNQLVMPDKVGIITSVDYDNNRVTLDKLPSEFLPSLKFDIIQERSPHRTISFDMEVTSIINIPQVFVTFEEDLPAGIMAGDQVALTEQSSIPQIPSELHNFLAQRVHARLMEAMGDTEGLQTANAKIAELENKSHTIIDNRIEGSPQKIVSRNSILSQTIRGGRRGFRRY